MVLSVTDFDNAELDLQTISEVTNNNGYIADTTTNRTGATINTLNGALVKLGFQPPVVYGGGVSFSTLADNTKTVDRSGTVYAPLSSEIPFTTTGTWGGSDENKFYVIQQQFGGDASTLNGQNGAFYQNSNNQNAGTLPSGRLSGNYNIGITGNAATATAATTATTATNATNATNAVNATGSVTSHSDISSAGSGAIITTSERNFIAAFHSGNMDGGTYGAFIIHVSGTTFGQHANFPLSGFAVTSSATGVVKVTHNLGTQKYTVRLTCGSPAGSAWTAQLDEALILANDFTVIMTNSGGSKVNGDFMYEITMET